MRVLIRTRLASVRPLSEAREARERSAYLPVVLAALLALAAPGLEAQTTRVSDLTTQEGEVPVQLTGFGLVFGLGNTGDRVFGSSQGGMTVRSIANLLRNFGVEVPERVIRSRNVAAVMVTALASPYTRRGGVFDVRVASIGDATSLRGGQLMTVPLRVGVNGPVLAVAEGGIFMSTNDFNDRDGPVETSVVLTDGAVAQADFGGALGPPSRLLLRRPDLPTAQLIADAINGGVGAGTATVEDPGSVGLQLPAGSEFATLVQIGDLTLTPTTIPTIVIDARSGAVAVGGDVTVGAATVSHEWLTLTIAEPDTPLPAAGLPGAGAGLETALLPPGAVRAEPGIRVQSLAEALHAVGATAQVMGAVFQSLRGVGALHADVQIR